MSDYNYSNVIRSVFISDGKIFLSTHQIKNTEYAFYLSHQHGTEKVFYSNNNEACFSIPTLIGEYTARFFYKTNNIIKYTKVFFIIDRDYRILISEIKSIVEEESYAIDYYPNGSAITFIVFNGDGSRKSTAPFGLGFLIKLGFNVVAVKQENNRYQSLSFSVFKDTVTPIVMGKQVFLYGSSLGGYCAAYFAGAVNGAVIAAAPRNPIHDSIKNLLNTEGDYWHKTIAENQLTDKQVLVILDPKNDIDRIFFESVVLPAYPYLTLLEAPHAGHEVLLHLNHTHQLKRIILNMVEGCYENISIDSSLDSPYRDRTLALNYFRMKNYRKCIYFASNALNESKKRKLDGELISLIDMSLKRLMI